MDFSLKEVYDKAAKLGKNIPESVLASIASSLLTSINRLDNLGMMHRDIKPKNVLINKNGSVKLCDYGEVGRIGNNNKCENKQKGTDRYKAVRFT